MSLKIVCSGFLVRHPVGGHTWHHLQYLVGFLRLGHDVTFFEDYGWPASCYDIVRDEMTADPACGLAYLDPIFRRYALENRWCYLAEDGQAHGMPRERLVEACRECDVYFNLSNINWIPELELCRRRALVDTDPVFTQIGALGAGGPFSRYHALFTYGENVHRPGCDMPAGGARWLPTRQPVVLDLWAADVGDPQAPITTVMNWSPIGDVEHDGRLFGQKSREFEPFFSLPRDTGERMQMAVSAPGDVRRSLDEGGWELVDPVRVTRDPWAYQDYLRSSRAEFCVAKHGYVVTRSGWFSDRSSAYLATGRPVVVEDTGFSDFLPCGRGLLAFRTPAEAVSGLRAIRDDYAGHCRAAREVIEHHFDARRVLNDLLEKCV